MENQFAPTILRSSIRGVSFGQGVVIVEPINLYECTISAGTFIGPFVEIQKNVTIGLNCKIQSHTFICELVTIGNNCFIGHSVAFVNDLFATGGPANGDKSLWKHTEIGDNVSIGSNSTILPVRVVPGCVIGAGSVVTKDLCIPGIYAGNPARLIRALGARRT